jgi:hypothetical protein
MVDLNIGPLDGDPFKLTSARSPLVSGSAPPSYSLGGALPELSMTHPMTGELLSTDMMSVAASGGTGSQNNIALGNSEVDHLHLQITELSNLLSVHANHISSSAVVEGTCCTGFVASGQSMFSDGSLDCLIGSGLPIAGAPAPNTVMLDGAGMRIVLNEQIVEGDGRRSLSMTVNAVHIHLDQVLVTGLGSISGNIYLGQSTAGLDCEGQIGGGLCFGDCNRNLVVSINELITGVNIALGNMPMSTCTAMDGLPLDGGASINELITAVYNLLYGCPGTRGER